MEWFRPLKRFKMYCSSTVMELIQVFPRASSECRKYAVWRTLYNRHYPCLGNYWLSFISHSKYNSLTETSSNHDGTSSFSICLPLLPSWHLAWLLAIIYLYEYLMSVLSTTNSLKAGTTSVFVTEPEIMCWPNEWRKDS